MNEKKLTLKEREKISRIGMKYFKGEIDYNNTVEMLENDFNLETIRIANSGKLYIKLVGKSAELFEYSLPVKKR